MEQIIQTNSRSTWRSWLNENFEKENQVWFSFPLLKAREQSLSYNDVVEEALCFGWIDSTIKYLDPLHRIQRFTPRKPGSPYSRANIERLIWLDKQNLVHPRVRDRIRPIIEEAFVFPSDIIDEIRKNPEAWKNYQGFSDSYKRIRIAYVNSARKRPDEFEKRLKYFIARTRENSLIKGFGGIDKYY